jgi:hypothetical protein
VSTKNGAFNFTNQTDMIRASKLIRDTMTRFGLIMHIGLDGGKLKTKAIHPPLTLEEASKMKNETPGEEEVTFTVGQLLVLYFKLPYNPSQSSR